MHLQILAPKQTLEYCIFVLKQYEQTLTQLLVQSCSWEKINLPRKEKANAK